jgi:hypothetical protein
MTSRVILLAGHNPRDEELTLRALNRSGIEAVRNLGLYWPILTEVAGSTARPSS